MSRRRHSVAGLALIVLFQLLVAPRAMAEAAPRLLQPGEMLRGRFVQERVLAGFAKPLHSEGSFILVVGQGLIWQSEKPFHSTTVITPAGILQMVNGAEAMRLPASRLPVLSRFYEVLSGALSGDPSALQHDFHVARGDDAERWRLTLVPAHPQDPAMGQVESIAVSGPALADEVEIRKSGGDLDRLHFLDQTVTPIALSPDETKLLGALAQ